jgi:predicted nucleic acid-binding protein
LILLDSSGLLAVLNDREPLHREAAGALDHEPPPYVLSPFVLAELDYLLGHEAGPTAEIGLLRDVAAGSYQLAPFGAEDVGAATQIVERCRDLKIGLADASIVVLAERYGTTRVLTLDERHFRALRTTGGKRFTILPADV